MTGGVFTERTPGYASLDLHLEKDGRLSLPFGFFGQLRMLGVWIRP